MKAKIMNRGAGFRGVLDYAYKSTAVVIGGNMSGTNARDLATEFGVARQMRPDVEKPVWHCSLSLPAGEKISDEKWLKIADKFMKDMEFTSLNQYHVVKHEDTDKQHIHIIANRVGLDGSLWYGKREALKAIDITQKLEKEFGLVATVGLENKNGKKSLTKGEIEMSLRTGEAPAKQILQNTIDTALGGKGNKQSIFAFMERLEKADIKVIPNVAKTGKMNGFSFECGGVYFKGSQLGKKYSWNELIKRGVTYEQDREGEKLIERAEQAKATSSIESGAIAAIDPSTISGNSDRATQVSPDGRAVSAQSDAISPGVESVNRTFNANNKDSNKRLSANTQPVPRSDSRSENRNIEPEKVINLESVRGVVVAGGDAWGDVNAVIAELNGASESSVLKPDHQEKIKAWAVQSEALNAERYRITCMSREGKPTFVLGKQKDGSEEITYTKQEVETKIGQLRRNNAQGYDIYITPIDSKFHYMVIDDIKPENLEIVKQKYSPCMVQASSLDNFQAVVKFKKSNDLKDHDAAKAAVQEANDLYGDPKVNAIRQPFRMAGFSNKKPSRNNFITRVIENMKGLVSNCLDDFIRAFKERAPEVKEKKKKEFEFEQVLDSSVVLSSPEVQTAFERSHSKYVGLAEKNGWTKNDSAIDFNVAKDLLKQKFPADTVGQALKDFSPDLSRRHKDVDSYVEKTIESAKRGMNNGYKI